MWAVNTLGSIALGCAFLDPNKECGAPERFKAQCGNDSGGRRRLLSIHPAFTVDDAGVCMNPPDAGAWSYEESDGVNDTD